MASWCGPKWAWFLLVVLCVCASCLDARVVRPTIAHTSGVTVAASCSLTLTTGSGKSYTFTDCYPAAGGFSVLWNKTVSGSDTVVDFGVQRQWRGWMAFGKSPDGAMLDSSVIMSIYKRGRYTVQQYTTGSTLPAKPKPGGSLTVSNLKGEFAKGLMTTFATVTLPTSTAQSCLNLIYTMGPVSFLRKPQEHDIANAHSTRVLLSAPPSNPPTCIAGS